MRAVNSTLATKNMLSREELIQNLYSVFDIYAAGEVFSCSYCYSEEEIEYYKREKVVGISIEAARIALWETGDHWSNSQAYRHFLPRMLEVMGPPHHQEDIYVAHLFNTLTFHDFKNWPQAEKAAVVGYLTWLEDRLDLSDEEDRKEWNAGMEVLAVPH